MTKDHIIFFDGVCGLCNHSVDFVRKRDKKNLFLFSSLQSQNAQDILKDHHYTQESISNIVYLRRGKVEIKSTAVLLICWDLGGLLSLASFFFIIPPFIRDFFYDIIARYRYKWFGKKDSCRLPTKEEKNKFLS